ncbi:MAG TPA: radical SAM protein [Pyrinomonadaceae bacterium]|nr:radical SAM protein [Pyrinomonadaceae bacterium]
MNSTALTYRRAYEGINYRLRTFAGGRWANYCRPTSIAILMTERCNARCIHCDIWKNRGKEDRPSFDEWSKLLEDLRKWLGPVHVVFTGGEALLNLHTVDLVSYASSIGLFVEVLSHGFWENQARIEALALARPARVTISFDGMGQTHSLIRGRQGFVEKTEQSIQTLKRIRRERNLRLAIRLKTVIMRQNLDDVCEVARFAQTEGLEVFYQPIEQNYNSEADSTWFEHSQTWPTDTNRALRVVSELREMKLQGLPIANSFAQLDAMTPYFADPASSRLAIQLHSAHERQLLCSALTTLQLQANGDVTVCSARAPIGNIRTRPIKQIWNGRPHWWQAGCCLSETSPR